MVPQSSAGSQCAVTVRGIGLCREQGSPLWRQICHSLHRWLPLALLALAAFSVSAPARAWGVLGHHIVAALAERQLTPQARAQVQALLALEPGASLVSISTWADENRTPETATWHFVNFERGDCHFDAAQVCPGGQCVVQAIETQLALLQSSAPAAERLMALKYLVHFVADIHQPLHAGFGDDRGGNRYQLSVDSEGTNLHAFWDTALLTRQSPQLSWWLAKLSPPAAGAAPASDWIAPERIAEASCAIVAQEGFYPPHRLAPDYEARYRPVADQQLRWAAARLAALLNSVWP